METTTDKRTDVWSRDFMIWKINFGLWAVAWAGLWNERVWADYEQFLRPVFSLFRVQKFKKKKIFCKKDVMQLFSADCPELIFHIMKSRDQTSVLLSVY